MIRKITKSNSLVSGLLTNYQMNAVKDYQVDMSAKRYNSCSCASSFPCVYPSSIYIKNTTKTLFTVPGWYTGCYVIESLLQSTLQCFYNQSCIYELQTHFPSPSLNVTALDSSLQSKYFENSTIQELLDQLMIEEWNPLPMYDSFYNECQPKQCTYTVETRNDLIYIVTTFLGIVGGLVTVLKLVIPRLVKLIRKKKELTRSSAGKSESKRAR
jgi:hypothetical protein